MSYTLYARSRDWMAYVQSEGFYYLDPLGILLQTPFHEVGDFEEFEALIAFVEPQAHHREALWEIGAGTLFSTSNINREFYFIQHERGEDEPE